MADLTFYYGLFGGWALAAAGLELGSRFGKKASAIVTTDLFKGFRNNYLLVYSLMMGTLMICRIPRTYAPPSTTAGDWLQGPYVYALYRHYGFDRGAIGQLFIAGFGSSMIFGTIVGAMADK